MTDCAGKEMHFRLSLGDNKRCVPKRARIRVKCRPHKLRTDQIVRVAGTLSIRRFSSSDLYFLERLEDRYVMVTAKKLRPDLFRQPRL